MKRKAGEEEAIVILKSIGVEIDTDYQDDNSENCMPDLKYADGSGRYVEVTHTRHDRYIYEKPRQHFLRKKGENKEKFRKRLEDTDKRCSEALERFRKADYDCDKKGVLSPEAQRLRQEDIKILKKHWGWDVTKSDPVERHSEFGCDIPTVHSSADNILYEIEKDKGKKYPDGNVDLFIYVNEEEYEHTRELISQYKWNGTVQNFFRRIQQSPFQTVYVCEWDLRENKYNVKYPKIMKICKTGDTIRLEMYGETD